MNRAVFLDRDGVLNRDVGYAHRRDELELLPGVIEGLGMFQRAGFHLIVVTNQSGIARGYYTEADCDAFHDELKSQLWQHGIVLTAIYSCPHLEDATVARYAKACDCRKPAPGMVLRGLHEHDIDAGRSIMVGDRRSDLQAGRAAAIAQCFLIGPPGAAPAFPPEADAAFDSLEACARHVLQPSVTTAVQPCP